jgi:L-arabinose isomerase
VEEDAVQSTVAVVHPYWDFWEASVDADLRADRQRLLDRAVAVLAPHHQVVLSEVVSSPEEAAGLSERVAGAHALVLVSTMAAPSATAAALLELVPRVPLVIWALHGERAFPRRFTHSDITTRGATVGGPMIGSALARSGRFFDVALTHIDAPQPALDAVRRAAAAGRLRASRVLRVGPVMPGYTSVDATDADLAGLGMTSVSVPPGELRERAALVDPDRVRRLTAEVHDEFDLDAAVSPVALERALRVEAVLTDLMDETGSTHGAFNCHIPEVRFGSELGIAPCLALGRITTGGRPWTCAGDVVTSIAMMTLTALGRPSLYHEVEAVDWDRDEVIIANTGEHDLGLCAGRPRLVPDVWYEHDPVVSACAEFTPPAGPASLVGFVLAGGPRWVVAEGAFTGTSAPGTGTPNAGFRFATGPVGEAWPRWARAGVTHHSAATNALVAGDVEVVARHLGGSMVLV